MLTNTGNSGVSVDAGRRHQHEDPKLIAWACALGQAVADYGPLLRARNGRSPRPRPRIEPCLNTRAAILYRAGRFKAARDTLLEALDAHRESNGELPSPQDWLFLAMTQYRLGQADEATRWLDKTRRWLRAAPQQPAAAATAQPLPRAEELEIELLLREAERLIDGN